MDPNESYTRWNKAGKVSLFFFAGFFFFFSFDLVNWTEIGLAITGFFMLGSVIFLIYNDYKHKKYVRVTDKIIILVVIVVFAVIALTM